MNATDPLVQSRHNLAGKVTPPRTGAPQQAALGLPTKLYYGFGSVAFGVKDNGFSYFLLIFYNQVIGLPSAMVGLAIMIALVFDALVDPVVGQWSDNLNSRWGRRHPFMYAAAIPLGLTYQLLWNPPTSWGEDALFLYLVAVSVLVRAMITAYEIPSSALAAELTSDYDDRTSLLSYRYLFGWLGGITMYYLALQFFLRPAVGSNTMSLDPAGYSLYGLFGGAMIIAAIFVSALGTHKYIPSLRAPPHASPRLGRMARELFETLKNWAFLSILGASIFNAMAIGLAFSTSLYFLNYFWELSAAEVVLFSFSSLASVVVAFILAPRLPRQLGKKWAAVSLIGLSAVIAILPVLFRLWGFLPPNGTFVVVPLLLMQSFLSNAFGITGQILFSSMIADVVDDAEMQTGRRQEGVFFAGAAFVAKAVSGIGILSSGLLLAAVDFPQAAVPGHVSLEVLYDLGFVYVIALVVINAFTLICLTGYPLTRRSHDETIAALAAGLITESGQ